MMRRCEDNIDGALYMGLRGYEVRRFLECH